MARVCFLLAEGFDDSEYAISRARLESRGHQAVVVGADAQVVVSGTHGREVALVDSAASRVTSGDFDAIVIPGGRSPDKLRSDASVVSLVRSFGSEEKVIAAICHGPQLLIEADLARGRTMTSWPSVRKDVENSGAEWVDEEVCLDGNLITSRNPSDLEVFSQAILGKLATR